MNHGWPRKTIAWLARIGADPADGDEVRLRKAFLVSGSFMFILAGAVWGVCPCRDVESAGQIIGV